MESASVGAGAPYWAAFATFLVLTTSSAASTPTNTPTLTFTVTNTPTVTQTSTNTPTPTQTPTPSPTSTLPTNTPTPTVTPVPGGCTYIQAEAGVLTSPMFVAADPLASGGRFVTSTVQGKNVASPTGGIVTFSFTLGATGYLNHRILAASAAADSFYLNIDGVGDGSASDTAVFGTNTAHTDDDSEGTWQATWQRTRMVDRMTSSSCNPPVSGNPAICQVSLGAGAHTLAIRMRDPNSAIDWIAVCPDSTLAPDPPGVTPTQTPAPTATPNGRLCKRGYRCKGNPKVIWRYEPCNQPPQPPCGKS